MPQPGVQLSPHEDFPQDVDVYFAEDLDEVRGAPELTPIDVLSGSQLSGALVGTQAQVESTPCPWDHGSAGFLTASPCRGPGPGTPH